MIGRLGVRGDFAATVAAVERTLFRLLAALTAVLIAALAAAVIYVVAMRFLAGRVPFWSEELPRILLVWATLLGTAANAARGGNLHAGVLHLWLRSPRWRRAVLVAGDVMVLLFSFVLVYAGMAMAAITATHVTPGLQLSGAVFYWGLPVAGTLLAIAQIATIARRLASPVDDDEGAV